MIFKDLNSQLEIGRKWKFGDRRRAEVLGTGGKPVPGIVD